MVDASHVQTRLLSIQYDVETFLRPLLASGWLKELPIVANERCGTWYAFPLQQAKHAHHSCYFKSTDGHTGTWNFSLKRLNLSLLKLLNGHGACVIVDASSRKELPDSLSRTIPIWAAVLNRVAQRYRRDLSGDGELVWDTELYTPPWLVSKEEHDNIRALLEDRAEALYSSGAIVNPRKLVETLSKPLKPCWITPSREEALVEQVRRQLQDDAYVHIVSINASNAHPSPQHNDLFETYVAGAADDHETWARGLTPSLFWNHVPQLLNDNSIRGYALLEAMDRIVSEHSSKDKETKMDFDAIGFCGEGSNGGLLFVGSRRAGRPPQCWQHFDAILNVTEMEYEEMRLLTERQPCTPHNQFYLQMPVREGKRDKTELERCMALGVAFVTIRLQSRHRVLIHCAQGKDRSVAVAMAVCALLCRQEEGLPPRERVDRLSLASLYQHVLGCQMDVGEMCFGASGLPQGLAERLLDTTGRQRLLTWIAETLELGTHPALATKDSLRVALHLIQQHRECASPTRSTMQKLNRFFMS